MNDASLLKQAYAAGRSRPFLAVLVVAAVWIGASLFSPGFGALAICAT